MARFLNLPSGTSHLPRQFSARMNKQSTNQNLRSVSDKYLTWNTELEQIPGNYLIMLQSQHNGPRESLGLSPEDNFHLRQTEETRILLMNTLNITGASLKHCELFYKSHIQKLKPKSLNCL